MAVERKYLSLEKLGLYDEKIKGVITSGDAATLAEAKKYADGLAVNYDAAGSSATVQGKLDEEIARAKVAEEAALKAGQDAQAEVDALELVVETKAAQTDVDALAGKVGEVPEGSTVMGIITNIQENAYDDTEIQGLIAGLEADKADKTQVATDIASAKAELEGKVALKADQTALDEVATVAAAAATAEALAAEVKRAGEEEARIEGLVTAETERATGVEADFEERIATMEVFWDTTEDADGVVNKLKEIQKYIADDETGAAAMAGSIQDNADAIAAMDEAYKAADVTLQGNIDTLAGTVATKAAQADLEALELRVEANEGGVAENAEAIAALQGADTTLAGRIEVLEGAIGESGSVAEDIAEAKQEAIDAAAQAADTKDAEILRQAKAHAEEEDAKVVERVAALEAAAPTHALASDLTALAGRVTTAEGEIDTLQQEMDAVELLAAANKSAHEANAAAIALKASQADLEALEARVATNEAGLAAFVEISETEINALFPTV